MMRTIAIAAGLTVFVAGTVDAQSRLNKKQEQDVLEVLAGVGGACEKISRTQPVGQLPNKDTLMAVSCTGGEQYVVLVDQRARMTFYSTCAALAEANNNQIRCFN